MNDKKDFDPEVDIKFTVDKQIKELYEKQGIIEKEVSEEDKTSTLDLASQIEEGPTGMSLEIPDVEIEEEEQEDSALEVNSDDDTTLHMEKPDEVPIIEEEVTEAVQARLIFFDYRSEFFAYLIKELDENLNYQIIEEFEELPRELQQGENTILFLNYSAYPKLCSQLIPKVKTKFKSVKIVIVAKNLTPEKVQAHKNSPEGVHEYLSFPFSRDDFFRVISGEE